MKKRYYNYVVMLLDGRIKVGITGNPTQRRTRYNHLFYKKTGYVCWYHFSEGLPSKELALQVERELCRRNSRIAIPGHREWFKVPGGFNNALKFNMAIELSTFYRCLNLNLDFEERRSAELLARIKWKWKLERLVDSHMGVEV